MAYYDEGFREKMEGVAGGFAKQLKKLTGIGGRGDEGEEDVKSDHSRSERSAVLAAADLTMEPEALTPKSEEKEGEGEWKARISLPYLADVRAAGVSDAKEVKSAVAADQKPSPTMKEPDTEVLTLEREEAKDGKWNAARIPLIFSA